MPQPSNSIHPGCLHFPQPLPPQKMQLICTSALGSVKGKKDGKEARLHSRAEERLHRVVERSLQIAEGDIRIHAQALDLVEDGRMRRIGRIVAVNLARDHNTYRRRLQFHGADLYRRCVRPHQQPVPQRLALLARDHQRVLRIARRVVRRKIQRLEIVVIRLHFRTHADRIPDRLKHRDDLIHRLDQRMFRPQHAPRSRQRDVDGLLRRHCRSRCTHLLQTAAR